MKAYTKLTVVMCCQIVARKSVAPSSGDWCSGTPVDKIRNFEETNFLYTNLYAVFAAAAGLPRGGTPGNFQYLVWKIVGPPGPTGPQIKSLSDLWIFKITFFKH